VFGASFGKNSIVILPNFVSSTATLESANDGIKLVKSKKTIPIANILKFNVWNVFNSPIKANWQTLVFNE
jgi:hypothetical protein